MKKMLLLLILTLPVSCGSENWTMGTIPLDLAVADSPEERYRGLQDHDSLTGNQGMLFVYQSPRDVSFWMQGVNYPIDLAYINKEGRILSIHAMKANDETNVPSPGPITYVLEMRQGWFKDNNIDVGYVWQELNKKP